jgi:penicillin-binding protein 2
MNFHPNDLVHRSRVTSYIVLGIFAFLSLGFFRAQVLKHDKYASTSAQNRLRPIPLPAARGQILDRNGEIIAETVPGYLVALRATSSDSLRATLARMAAIVRVSPADIDAAINRLRQDPTRPTVVISDAPFDVVSVLEEHKVDFPGLMIQAAPKRHYPDGPAVAALVGYTGEISDAELKDAILRERYKAGQQIGRAGLEEQYEDALRGREGTQFVEVDARENIVREYGAPTQTPEAGKPLKTNIDLGLQRFVADSIFPGDTVRGGLLAMDPRTGAVLALYSAPTFDPNMFIGGMSSAAYAKLRTDPGKPFLNRVVQGLYPPASTFKLATAVIALEAGLVALDDTMPQRCDGGYQFGTRYFRCWKKGGHGSVTLATAIEVSCDAYFYQLGVRLKLARLLEGGSRLLFHDKTGIDLPGEYASTLPPDEAYFTSHFPKGWAAAEALNIAIGQGVNTQTIANMARFYSALATDGFAATPQIVNGEPERTRILQLTPDQMLGLRKALAGVVEPGGTAVSARIEGIALAGKTGTAQRTGEPDAAWFVGFAPADDPKILVAVLFEHGLHGDLAARAASRVINRYLKLSTVSKIKTEG